MRYLCTVVIICHYSRQVTVAGNAWICQNIQRSVESGAAVVAVSSGGVVGACNANATTPNGRAVGIGVERSVVDAAVRMTVTLAHTTRV